MRDTRAHGWRLFAVGLVAASMLLALGLGVAQAATMKLSKLRLGSATGAENYLFAAGDQVVAQGSVDASRHYQFVVTDPSATVRATSACRPSPGRGSVTSGYVVQNGDPVSASTAWRVQLQQFVSATCGGAPQKNAKLYFDVARGSAYSDASATLPKSVFAAGTTAYLEVAGAGKVKGSAANGQVTDWSTTWVAPGNGVACANTAGSDRPDATAGGLLPAGGVGPGTATTLRYRPSATPTGDAWNREANYETQPCADFSAANEGAWKVKLQRDTTHFVVLPAFTVDATPPDTVLSGGPSGTTSSSGATFHLSSTQDSASFECRLDGGSWQACSSPVTYSGLAEGAHSFSVRSTDAAGNADPTPATRSWTIDAPVPAVTLSTPADASSTNDATPAFAGSAGTATGDSDTVTVKVYAGLSATGTPVQTRTVSAAGDAWTTVANPPLPDGAYTVRAEQADATSTGMSDEHSFTVDTAAPRVGLVAPTAGSSTSDPDPALPGTAGTSPGDAGSVTVAIYAGSTTSGDPIETDVATVSGAGVWSVTPSQLGEGPYTVKVTQTDAAGNASSAAHGFTVDTTAPDTELDAGPTGGTSSTRARFEFSSSESGASFQCRLDAGLWTACASPKSYSGLAEGVHTFDVRAIDAAGNVDPEPASGTWTVNLALPQVTLTTPANDSATNDTTPALAGSASTAAGDSATVTVKLFATNNTGGSPVETLTATRTADGSWAASAGPALADGPYVAQAEQAGAAGTATSAPRSFRVDTTAPQTTLTQDPGATTSATSAGFGFESDESGARFECRLPAGAWTACDAPALYSSLAPGAHTFAVRAVDAAGNVDTTPATHGWTIDLSLPAVTLTAPADGSATSDTTPTFSGSAGTAAGDAGTVAVRLYAGGSTAGSPVQTLTTVRSSSDGSWSVRADAPLDEGAYTAYARQTGASGTGNSAVRSFTVDTTPPQTTLTSGPQGTTGAVDARFSFSASERGTRFECRLDGASWQGCDSPQAYSALAAGEHTFEVRAIDRAGNVDPVPATRTWTIDAAALVTLVSPADGSASTDTTPTFAGAAGTAATDASDVTVEVHEGTDSTGDALETLTTTRLADGTWAVTADPALPEGTYTAFAQQLDATGDNAAYSAEHTFTVDTTAPGPDITAPSAGGSAREATPTLRGTAGTAPGDASTLTLRLYDGPGASGTPRQTLTAIAVGADGSWTIAPAALPDGTYSLRASQSDAAGNTGASPARTFTVDTVAPETALTAGPTGSTEATSASFGFTSETDATFECRIDSAPWAACGSPRALSGLGVATHTFDVRAHDAAGNVDPTPATRTWTITAPTAPTGGGTGTGTNTTTHTSTHTTTGTAPTTNPAPGKDLIPPVIDRVSMAKRFMVSPRATARSARAKRIRRGTQLKFRLSEQATVAIRIERQRPGRRRARRCVKPTRRLAKQRACVRYVKVGTLTRRMLPAGLERVVFTGRIGRRALPAGRYRAVLVATDPSGNRSTQRTVRFQVLRGKRAGA